VANADYIKICYRNYTPLYKEENQWTEL